MLAWAGMKLSLPALPELERVFSTSGAALRTTVMIFFTFFALGQLGWGMLSDRIGRRKPLLIGLVMSAVGATIVLTSESVLVFGIGRSLEGLGLSAISPVGRAILFETRSHERAKHELARVSMCTAAIPMLGQVVGGYLVAYASWRWIFAGFIAFTVAAIIAIWKRLPETHTSIARGQPRATAAALRHILTSREYWASATCYIACSGTLLGYYAAMPFWYSKHLGIPVQLYPWLAGFTVGTYILAVALSKRIVARKSTVSVFWIGMFLALIPGLGLMALWSVELSLFATIVVLVGASMVLALAAGLIFPEANAGAVKPFPENRGLASAVTVTCVFLMAGLMAFLEGQLHPPDLGLIGLTLAAPFLLAIPIVVLLNRRHGSL
ncbi:MAG: MFS transporter [Phycisphaerales bacterium]|nr:MFS transporter [Phycisphaerales bacterium]